ncbi:MAG: putative homoserine dehydrogenase-like protein, partial [Alphaproteobacteria bacterium]
MNLHRLLLERDAADNPVRVALIGAGKFGTMYLSQAGRTPGIKIAALVDLDPARAKAACLRAGLGDTFITDDAMAVIAGDDVDVVIDATGSPAAGIAHALACCEHGKHIIMVNVEADVLAGPLLAERARQAGIVYSLAYGDQPALICEQVDWARACGLDVIAAGKGTKYLDGYHYVTPDDVWQHYGLTAEQAAAGGMNPQMFNSFLDGTKSAIEMAAVANATGLTPAPTGLAFPPVGVQDLARIMRPAAEGGRLHHKGQVEVVSSEERDGRHVAGDLRWGVYVV